MSTFPPQHAQFLQHISQINRDELEHFVSSIWTRFNISEVEKHEFHFDPDTEVGGGDLVEFTGQLLEIINQAPTS